MTAPVPDTVAQSAARHAKHVAEEANAYEAPEPATPPEGAAVDPTPVLDGVTPTQAEDTADRGVDMASMPAFRGVNHLLPSARFVMQAQMMNLVKKMPKEWTNGDVEPSNIDPADMDFDALSELITGAETFVLDLAADREAMEAWLIAQENGFQAVMDAFTKATDLLGN
ncbi:hypothetical protein [Corynebacterium sp.]|uniref:hypothetical protein n=1 Tax=Corynebacterium sp. TaxID=1720 RepID=UPI003B3A4DB9